MSRIKELQLEIERIKKIQSSCVHIWSEPKYDPIIERNRRGSDWKLEGRTHGRQLTDYVDRLKPRRTRVCKICELEQETVAIKTVTKPKF